MCIFTKNRIILQSIIQSRMMSALPSEDKDLGKFRTVCTFQGSFITVFVERVYILQREIATRKLFAKNYK